MSSGRQHSTAVSIVNPFPKWNYIVFALVAFGLHLALATRLYNLHVFQQYDVLFNADPNEGLVNLSHGWGKSEFKHLTLTYLFSPLARVFGMVVSGSSLSSMPAPLLRERFTLCLLAFLSAVRAATFLEVARFLGLRHKAALGLNALAFLAFSNLLFGSVPDSFALSGTCLVLAYYLALRPGPLVDVVTPATKRRVVRDFASWATLFVVSVGITITNVISIGLLAFLWLLRRSKWRLQQITLLVALTATTAIALNMGIAFVARVVLRNHTSELLYRPVSDVYVHKPSWAVVNSLARAFGNGFAPGAPITVPLAISPGKTVWYTSALTFETGKPLTRTDIMRTVSVLLALALGVAGYRQRRDLWPVLLASGAIIASNVALHLFFGDEYVLYSLHWHYSFVVLIAGALIAEPRLAQRRTWTAALGVALLCFGAANFSRIHSIVDTLAEMERNSPLHTPARVSVPRAAD